MSSQVSATAAVSYKGVFDQSIYDQSIFEDRKSVPFKELKAHLLKMKELRLEKVLLQNALQRIEQLKNIIDDGTPLYNYLIKPFGGAFVDLSGIEEWREISKDEAKKKLFELLFEIQLLKKALNKESICDLEYKYIQKKRRISPDICDQIEKILLMVREDGVPIQLFRAFIDSAIKMPNKTLQLSEKALKNITEFEDFGNFDPKLQLNIHCIAKKLIINSKQKNNDDISTRSIYYFYGNPGTGKSTTAKMIPKLLNLPHFICSIRSSTDLSADNLEGSTRTYNSHNPGLLANALMSKCENEKSYLNAVLIIEDFDRLLFPEGGGNISGPLAFLLDYLDPNKKDYFSPYFLAKINISYLSIILTANNPIPKKPENPTDKDPYAALRSRVTEVHFPDFPQQTLKSMCTPYAELMGEEYGITPKVINANKGRWVEKAIQNQREKSHALEPRDLKRQIELIVIEKSLEKGKKQRVD